MAPRQVYRSSLRVPVMQAPTIDRVDVSSGLHAVADGLREQEDRQRAAQLNEVELSMATEFSNMREESRRTDWREKAADFESRAAELKTGVIGKIKDPRVKAAAEASFQRLYLNGREHTRQDAFEGERDHHIANTETSLDRFAQDAAAARSPDERKIAIENGTKAIANLIDAGFIDEARGNQRAMRFKGDADLFTAEALVESDPYTARKLFGNQAEAQKRFPALDPRQILNQKEAADREVKQREAEARANANMARQEALFDIDQWSKDNAASLAATGQAVPAPYTDAQLKTILKPKQYETVKHIQERAAGLFSVIGDLRDKTPAEMQAVIDKAKPVAGQQGYKDQEDYYNAAIKLKDKVLAERKADPARASIDAFPAVALAWQQQNANPDDPGHLRVAIRKTLAAQESMGIAPDKQKPLPAQMAASIAGSIRGASPDKAAKVLQDAAARFGKDWSKVYGQIAPQLDPNSAAAATLSPNMAAVLLETSRTSGSTGKPGSGLDDLRRTLGVASSGVNSITAIIAEDGDFEDFRRAMARKGRGGNVGIAWSQAAETLALGIMQREGVSKEAAAQTAIKELVGSKYNFGRVNSVPFVTPKNVDADAAEASARQIMQTFKGADVDLPSDGRGVLTEDTRAAYVGAIQRDGYWVTTTGNSGLELWVGGAPVTHKGQRIVRTWEQLSDVAITPPSSSATSAKTGR